MKQKRCESCNETKHYSAFQPSTKDRTLYERICKECYTHKNQLKNKTKRLRIQLQRLGLTLEDYLALKTYQEDCCAICGRHESLLPNLQGTWKRLVLDHDHATGRVRGLLCQHCNRGLGSFYDSIPALQNAIRYLRIHVEHKMNDTTQLNLFQQEQEEKGSFPRLPLPSLPSPPQIAKTPRQELPSALKRYSDAARAVRQAHMQGHTPDIEEKATIRHYKIFREL